MPKGKYIRKQHSEETKRKISKSLKGKEVKLETREKLSRIHKGKHYNPNTEFKKGMRAWNNEGGERLSRKFMRVKSKMILRSHFIWCNTEGNLPYVPKGFVIHHISGNSLDDSEKNLFLMTFSDHVKLHNNYSLRAGEKLI